MPRTPIIATLFGFDTAAADGLTVRSSSPVLALCRQLVERGTDPERPLHAYRGKTLALIICRIGRAAALEVSGTGSGFRPLTRPGAASPSTPNAPARPRYKRRAAP